MDWKECCNKRIVKEIKVDKDMIVSLIKSSANKWQSHQKLDMDKVTAASKVSLAYDSLRELLEALAVHKKYKIYNHECYVAFLKEIMKESVLGDEFDDVRITRNNINYYGKEITPEDAEKVITTIEKIKKAIIIFLREYTL